MHLLNCLVDSIAGAMNALKNGQAPPPKKKKKPAVEESSEESNTEEEADDTSETDTDTDEE
jgi:translocation protein SEC63